MKIRALSYIFAAATPLLFLQNASAGGGLGSVINVSETTNSRPEQAPAPETHWNKIKEQAEAKAVAPAEEDTNSEEEEETIEDKGDVKISFSKSSNKDYNDIAKILKEATIFQELAKGINDTIALKRDINVSFEDCGEVNAYYNPENYKISMCYELIGKFMEVFGSQKDLTDEQKGVHVINAAIFTFYHELGHALVHNLDIPITGKEEDAVDELATIFLIEAGDEGESAVFSAIAHFASSAEEVETKLDDLAFWDEHSLDSQRVYSAICLIYGSNPEKHVDLVGEDGLPQARADRCQAEYEKKSASWNRLLEPFMKES